MFTKVSRFVAALVLAAVLAAPAAASVPPPTVTQVKSIITILPPIYHPGGYWLTGNVTTTKEPGGSKGRYVALFYKSDNLGIDYTGTTRGHGAGYWQVRVPNLVRFPFDAYVMDRFNSQLAWTPTRGSWGNERSASAARRAGVPAEHVSDRRELLNRRPRC